MKIDKIQKRKMLLAIFNTAALEDILLASKQGTKNTYVLIKDIEFEY